MATDKIQYKNFSLPKMIPIDYKNLSFGTSFIKAKIHSDNLDKQVLCVGLLEVFYKYSKLKSFSFIANVTGKSTHKNLDNIYEPATTEDCFSFTIPEKEIYFDYDMDQYCVQDPDINLNTTFLSFENYISNLSQKKTLYWMVKIAKDNNLYCSFNEKKFEFTITKNFVDLLCKDAYGENYRYFNAQVLEKYLSKSDSPDKKRNKI